MLAAGADYGAGWAGAARARPGRDGLREPDRADHRRVGAERRDRRLRRAAARVRRPRGRARVLLQRLRRARWSSSARRSRRSGAGRSRPRTATAASTSPSSRAPKTIRCRRCSRRSRRRSSASASTSTRGRCRASSSCGCREFLPRLDTYEKDGARLGALLRVRRRRRPRADPLAEKGGTPTYRAADVVYLADKLERGFDRAIYVLGADHHGTRNWYAAVARMLGYDTERIEVLLYQLVHLTKGGGRRRCPSAVATSSSSTSCSTRSASTRPAGTSPTAGPTRRSRSTSTSPPSAREKNPVYYVQYAHARIAGILRNAGDAARTL